MEPDDSRRRERGQVLIIFTLAITAIIAMTGLVIDGGMTSVQRRDMQNVADAAAMAAGYDYAWNANDASAAARARAITAANGYTDGQGGVSVGVSVTNGAGGSRNIIVNISKPHENYFSGVVGFSSWQVSTTATTEAGYPNAALGAMPLIFNKKVLSNGFGNDQQFDEPGSGSADVPSGPNQFNWTVFCTASGSGCNGDSSQVDDLITGHNDNPQDVTQNMVIGPLNAGSHTTLFDNLAAYIGQDFPVAIVDDSGTFVTLIMFHLTGSVGGSVKQIHGYFTDAGDGAGFHGNGGFHIDPNAAPGTSLSGRYIVTLIN
jgi:Flp pilus assembly protein TadG